MILSVGWDAVVVVATVFGVVVAAIRARAAGLTPVVPRT